MVWEGRAVWFGAKGTKDCTTHVGWVEIKEVPIGIELVIRRTYENIVVHGNPNEARALARQLLELADQLDPPDAPP